MARTGRPRAQRRGAEEDAADRSVREGSGDGAGVTPGEELQRLTRELAHREMELECVFELTRLIERHGADLERVLRGVARILSATWPHPENTCSRVVLDEREYRSSDFRATPRGLTSAILVSGLERGRIEVSRIDEMAEERELFLDHEARLLDAVAERVGRVTERLEALGQLEIERASLNNTNIALREVLERVQQEKREIGRAVSENVSRVVMPLVHGLERELSRPSRHLELIKQQLEELTSSFTREFSREFLRLTPAELQVCHLVRQGLTSKEIARVRGVSPITVSRQRDRIRRKLGLTHSSTNLVTFLRRYAEDLVRGE